LAYVQYQNPPQRGSGFTLIELVIVVIIVAVLGAIALPRFARSIDIHRAETAAKRIVHDLNLARESARAQSASVTVSFDPASDAYTMSGQSDLDHANQQYAVSLRESPFHADLVSAVFDGDAEVVFDGYGLPDSGGTIVLETGHQEVVVELAAETGRSDITASGGK